MNLFQKILSSSSEFLARRPKKKAQEISDGRLAVRKRQRLVEGYIWSDEMLVARGCIVKDISAVGAQVELWHEEKRPLGKAFALPDALTLYICPDRVEVDCAVTWRGGPRKIGVRFLGKFRPSTKNFA